MADISNSPIKLNTEALQILLDAALELDEAGAGVDTSDATATADDIMLGETAYISNGKTTGTFTIQEEINDINEQLVNIKEALNGKAGSGGTMVADTYTIRNNLDCEVYIGGTCIASRTSMEFPITNPALAPILFAAKGDYTALGAILNNTTTATMVAYTSAMKYNGQTMTLNEFLTMNSRMWAILFTSISSLANGDIITIYANGGVE